MEMFFELAAKTGNWGAITFGLFGMIVTGFFGWLLKRPMMRQAAENERFTATISGYKSLTESQANRIVYLENQINIRDEYENELLKRLRDCEERHIRRDEGAE